MLVVFGGVGIGSTHRRISFIGPFEYSKRPVSLNLVPT